MPTVRDYQDASSLFTEVEGIRVHYKREGCGPVMVLLHGSGSSLHCFDEVVPRLAGAFEVIRLDLPGAGLTDPRRDRDYRIETYVRFLDNFTQALSINRFSLGGNSLGGNIAWCFALDCPHKVENLLLMNATGYPGKKLPLAMRLAKSSIGRFILRSMISKPATKKNLRKLVGARMGDVPDAMVDRVYTLMAEPANKQAFIDLARTNQRDRSLEIKNIVNPTIIMRGESVDGQHFARDIKNSRDILLPGVGNLIPEEAPGEIADAVIKGFAK
ncbi:alpha/beta hydrolase [Pseudomonas sp. SO81]|jgi:pimeloyl-ACP methyl ester carboxylesterase|uniref:alpha/beta fold hydrolase n=1 Tax=Pseudomonas sp. SO81 TaxID=2983246 RepID=UPI0025A48B18|nr:alpha/beta hydrolase [Pseudomonas sp. SO81]WJN58881.1 hypothetical protein OH686_09060 [Pseudomonas sp. SO81]